MPHQDHNLLRQEFIANGLSSIPRKQIIRNYLTVYADYIPQKTMTAGDLRLCSATEIGPVTLPFVRIGLMGHACSELKFAFAITWGKLYSGQEIAKNQLLLTTIRALRDVKEKRALQAADQFLHRSTSNNGNIEEVIFGNDSVFAHQGLLNNMYGDCGILMPLSDWNASLGDKPPVKETNKTSWLEEFYSPGPVDLAQAIFLAPLQSRYKVGCFFQGIIGGTANRQRIDELMDSIVWYDKKLFDHTDLPDQIAREKKRALGPTGLYDKTERDALMNALIYFFHTKAGRRELATISLGNR